MTTVPQARACSTASRRSPVTTTPLPAASPSALTTYGGPNSSRARLASAAVLQVRAAAVGMPAADITCLAKDFEPSIAAAAWLGPKQATPAARTASATPATSGASGPITTRSAPVLAASAVTLAGSAAATSWISARRAMPGLPGAACKPVTPPSRASARVRACSRPPDPMTRTRTAASLPGRMPPRPGRIASDQGPELSRQTRGRIWSVWSRRGPTPIPHSGAPIMSSSART